MMHWKESSGAARDWVGALWAAALVCLFFGGSGVGRAAEWYAAPEAGAEGTGTIGNPWALQTAIDRVTPIRSGDVLWLRGGIYQSNYLSYLTGEANRYIVVRPYKNERVMFDGSPLFPNAFPLTIEGAWTIYRDFEVTHSATWVNPVATPVAIQCIGANVKFVNLVIHDAGQGIGFWKEAIDSEIYGCLIYYNGVDSQEHGIYTQNDVGTKRIRDSIIFHNSGYGIHAYAQNGYARNYDIQGNILFQNGSDNGELFVGSFFPTANLNVVSNYMLAGAGLSEPVIRLNDRDHSSNPNGLANVRGNYIVGGSGFFAQDFTQMFFSNNLVLSSNLQVYIKPPPGVWLGSYRWDVNRYFGVERFQIDQSIHDFPRWLVSSSLDGQSSHTADRPAGVDVFVRPNVFEPKRANVVIYNWDAQDNVAVDVSAVLMAGDRFELRNAQDYLGPVVLEGVYLGEPLLVPMTNLAVALPRRDHPPPPSSGPFFGAFVVSTPFRESRELLAHWTFDEGGGQVVHDSASGRHGVLAGNPQWVPGASGTAMEFNGAGDLVEVLDHPAVDLTNDLSVSFWFRPGELMNGSTGRRDLLAKYISYWVILNYPFHDGRLTFGFNSGAPYVRSTRTSWEPGQWYHVVGTFDGLTMHLYVNGELEGTTSTTYRVRDTPRNLQLGGNNVQSIYYKGALDDIRFYNYALGPEEVLDLGTNQTPANAAPILGPLPDRTVLEGQPLVFRVAASDPDSAIHPLTFSLEPGAPAGVHLDGPSGWFIFRPSEAQGPGEYSIGVRVHDNDMPSLSAVGSFVVTVVESNLPPQLGPIGNRFIAEETALVIDLPGSDPDWPPNILRYELGPGVPAGVVLNPETGRLVWVPSELAGPSTNLFIVRVTDQGQPPLSAQRAFIVVVTEANRPPRLEALPNVHATEGLALTVPLYAFDDDWPPNHLELSLDPGAPPGAVVDPVSRLLHWNPSGPGRTYPFTVRVRDDGLPALDATRTFLVTVHALPRVVVTDKDSLTLELSWATVPGTRYRVSYKTLFGDPQWFFLPEVRTAPGSSLSWRVPWDADAQRFYQVMVLP